MNKNKEIVFPYVSGVPASFPVDKTSNIVFSVDKKYKEYLKVAIKSAIVNKNKDSYYNIYILCVDLSKKDRDSFKVFESDKVKINTVELKLGMLRGIVKRKINLHYVSQADFFKIFMPEIFKNFDKILYLDTDILILKDLTKLYQTNLGNKYIGAIKRFDFSPKLKNDVYNCGVLLFNLKKCRDNKISEEIVEFKNNNKKNTTLTQYPFNKILNRQKTLLLSPIYNNIILPEEHFNIEMHKKNYAPHLNDIKDFQDLKEKTVIAHFAGIQKPWYNPEIEFGELWWQYAHQINPKWEKEKRNPIKHMLNSFAIMTKFCENNTFLDYFRNFWTTFKDS